VYYAIIEWHPPSASATESDGSFLGGIQRQPDGWTLSSAMRKSSMRTRWPVASCAEKS
jgi:hypothetical protein